MDLGVSGLASGFDWRSMIDQLADVERAPQRRLLSEQVDLGSRNTSYGEILNGLTQLKTRSDALKDASLFLSHSTSVGDSTIASATAGTAAASGTYSFNITQLATASLQQGTTNMGRALNATNNVSSLVLSSAGLAKPVSAGTLTVNGKQLTVAVTDTLQQVFDKISVASGSAVAGSYDPATDKITLTGTGTIVLGSAADTSNFFQVAKLYNNGSGSVASSAGLGAIDVSSKLGSGNYSVAVSDGGSGSGSFKINGVSIAFSATNDSASDVMDRINKSDAGVVATYDPSNDRFILTNKTTGDVGVALEDVTGNFLAATGLSGGALARGNNLLFTINNGPQLVSRSNTITEADSNLTGLQVTALDEGTTTIQVTSDTSKIKTAITDFIADYNKLQSLIDTNTASSTDAKGKVTAGVLASESEPNEISSRLRGFVNQAVSGMSGTLKQLAGLGINSNGTDNTIALSDSSKLDDALLNNLANVKDLFASSTGLATSLSTYLTSVTGDDGLLVTKQNNLTKQSASIDTQVAEMERQVQNYRDRLTQSFLAMEQAQSKVNQQLAFLQKQLGSS